MQATKLLRTELEWIHMGFHSLIDDMTEEEWSARPVPGLNLPGFTLWHVARTPDYIVQTGLRHVPEVITQERWASCGALTTLGFGLSVTLEQADAIARGLNREDVSTYADAVLAEVLAWLDTLSDDDLDTVPRWHTYIAEYPQYNVPEIVEAPEDPIWDYLLGTCSLHVRGHLAEVSIIKQQIRQGPTVLTSVPTSAPKIAPDVTPEPVAALATSAQPARRRWPWGRQ
jgi:hypothetical protein